MGEVYTCRQFIARVARPPLEIRKPVHLGNREVHRALHTENGKVPFRYRSGTSWKFSACSIGNAPVDCAFASMQRPKRTLPPSLPLR